MGIRNLWNWFTGKDVSYFKEPEWDIKPLSEVKTVEEAARTVEDVVPPPEPVIGVGVKKAVSRKANRSTKGGVKPLVVAKKVAPVVKAKAKKPVVVAVKAVKKVIAKVPAKPVKKTSSKK